MSDPKLCSTSSSGITWRATYHSTSQVHALVVEAGIVGKKGLLLSPAIYPLSMPITITTPGFVILGLGFTGTLAEVAFKIF